MDDAPLPETRSRMLRAARRLIAARGVDGVAVRDILERAGVRNGGALHYYFGTKEDLIRELIEMGARKIDERRIQMLDEHGRDGRSPGLADIARILVESAVGVSKHPRGEDSYTRFILAVQSTHHQLLDQTVAGRWDLGYRRAIDHVRRLLPQLPADTLEQRLAFMSALINSVLARREAYVVEGEGPPMLGQADLLDNLVGSVVGLLAAPHTVGGAETQGALG